MGAFAHQHQMENQASTAARQNAKALRSGMTDAERRSAWLARQGFTVLRFWANEVLSETDAVVISISQSLGLAAVPAPTPTLPQRGRESIQGKTP